MLRLPQKLGNAPPLSCQNLFLSPWRPVSAATVLASRTNHVNGPFQARYGATATLACPARRLHTSLLVRQQQSPQQPPGDKGGTLNVNSADNNSISPTNARPSSSPSSDLPSIEPVLTELRSFITRRYAVGEVYRALSPASRKLLVAHKLPLEELLLHLPENFLLWRTRGRGSGDALRGAGAMLTVSPPHLILPGIQPLRLPPTVKPLPALVALLGEEAASKAIKACTSMPHSSGTGTGFIDPNSTSLDRLQEVLTYIPNEWTPFSDLNISQDVKMRCMGVPAQRVLKFFLKHPKYFDVRLQHRTQHTFEVRRSLALQKQLHETASRRK